MLAQNQLEDNQDKVNNNWRKNPLVKYLCADIPIVGSWFKELEPIWMLYDAGKCAATLSGGSAIMTYVEHQDLEFAHWVEMVELMAAAMFIMKISYNAVVIGGPMLFSYCSDPQIYPRRHHARSETMSNAGPHTDIEAAPLTSLSDERIVIKRTPSSTPNGSPHTSPHNSPKYSGRRNLNM